jgi:hypothetical protein
LAPDRPADQPGGRSARGLGDPRTPMPARSPISVGVHRPARARLSAMCQHRSASASAWKKPAPPVRRGGLSGVELLADSGSRPCAVARSGCAVRLVCASSRA